MYDFRGMITHGWIPIKNPPDVFRFVVDVCLPSHRKMFYTVMFVHCLLPDTLKLEYTPNFKMSGEQEPGHFLEYPKYFELETRNQSHTRP